MGKHALLSASSSHRWLNCTPSARLEEHYPDTSTRYAEEGTAAHELCEYKVKHYLHGRMARPQSEFYTEEIERYTDVYLNFFVDTLEEVKQTCPVPMVMVEKQLDYSNYAPAGFGTADCIIAADGTMHVIDFKTGFQYVEVRENPQLMLYGLGALNACSWMYDIRQVALSIVQPRVDNVATYTCSVEELIRWGDTYVKPRAALAYQGKGELVPGEHCKFCRHQAHCVARAEEALNLAQKEFCELDGTEKTDAVPNVRFKNPATLDHREIEALLPMLHRISEWIDGVFAYASEEAINHGAIWHGYKVVEGRSVRRFTDEKQVEQAAVAAGYLDIYKKSLISLTEFEKLMGKKKFQEILGGLVCRPPGKLTLVPETDKRPAVDLTAAPDEFTALD